jgi:hypothetical protein
MNGYAVAKIVAGLIFFGGLYLFWSNRERRQIKAVHSREQVQRDTEKLKRSHTVKDGSQLSAHPGKRARLQKVTPPTPWPNPPEER